MRPSATLFRVVAAWLMVLGLSAAMADVVFSVNDVDVKFSPGKDRGVLSVKGDSIAGYDSLYVNLCRGHYLLYQDVDFGTEGVNWMSVYGSNSRDGAECFIVLMLDTIDLINGTGNYDTMIVAKRPSATNFHKFDTTITDTHDVYVFVSDSMVVDSGQPYVAIGRVGFYSDFPYVTNACTTIEAESFHVTDFPSIKTYPPGWIHELKAGHFIGWHKMDFGSDSADAIVVKARNKSDHSNPLWVILDNPDTADGGTLLGKFSLPKDTATISIFDLSQPVADTHSVFLRAFIGSGNSMGLNWFYFGKRTDITSAKAAPSQTVISAANVELTCKPQGLTYSLPANDVRTVYLYGPDGALIRMIYNAQSTGMIPVSNLPSGRFILRAVGNKGTVSYPFSIIR